MGHLLDFTEKGQTSGYLRITQAQTHFLQDPNRLIKSISWEFQVWSVPSSVTSPVAKARSSILLQHSEQGSFIRLNNEVFQPPQGKTDDRAFAEGVLHLLDNLQDDLTLSLLAGEQKMMILPLVHSKSGIRHREGNRSREENVHSRNRFE